MHERLEERAGRQHDGLRPVERVAARLHADHAADASRPSWPSGCSQSSISNRFDDFLPQRQVGLRLDAVLHRELVELLVRLGPRRVHGRALGAVEHAELNAAGVDDLAHFAAQGVDLADDLPLGDAADGRVAAHLGDGVGIHGQEGGAQPHPGRGQGRLDAGVAGADDDDIEIENQSGHGRLPALPSGATLSGIYRKWANRKRLTGGGTLGMGTIHSSIKGQQ